jgi:hypothetical protein
MADPIWAGLTNQARPVARKANPGRIGPRLKNGCFVFRRPHTRHVTRFIGPRLKNGAFRRPAPRPPARNLCACGEQKVLASRECLACAKARRRPPARACRVCGALFRRDKGQLPSTTRRRPTTYSGAYCSRRCAFADLRAWQHDVRPHRPRPRPPRPANCRRCGCRVPPGQRCAVCRVVGRWRRLCDRLEIPRRVSPIQGCLICARVLLGFGDRFETVCPNSALTNASERERFTTGLGPDWATAWQAHSRGLTSTINVGDALEDFFCQQLRLMGYEHVEPLQAVMKNSKNGPLYRLILAAHDDLAVKLWRGISEIRASGQRSLGF